MNILLSFLSTAKRYAKNEGDIAYEALNIDGLGKTWTTNESGLRYVLQKIIAAKQGEKLDAFIALASNKFRNEIIAGRSDKSIEYFEKRLEDILKADYYQKYFKLDKSIVKYIEYDEDGTKDASIATISAAIKKIKEISSGETVNLYLDVSGGMRDASVILLITSRILEHEDGITMKDVIYSNLNYSDNTGTVESVLEVYSLLDLLAGVEEFVQYGRADILNRQVFVKTDRAQKELFSAMTDFSKKILVCHYGEFKQAIANLKSSLQNFKDQAVKNKDATGKAAIMYNFVQEIENKYKDLFAENMNTAEYDVKLIEWCYNNGYLQQAMTLITERIPNYLFTAEKPLLEYLNYNGGIKAFNNDFLAGGNKYTCLEEMDSEARAKFYYWVLINDKVGSTSDYARLEKIVKELLKHAIFDKKPKYSQYQDICVELQEELKKAVVSFVCDDDIKNHIGEYLNIDEVVANVKKFRTEKFARKRTDKLKDFGEDCVIARNLAKAYPEYQELTCNEFFNNINPAKSRPDKDDINKEAQLTAWKNYKEELLKSIINDSSTDNQAEIFKRFEKQLEAVNNDLKKVIADYKAGRTKTIDYMAVCNANITKADENYHDSYKHVKMMLTYKRPKLASRIPGEILGLLRKYFDVKNERNAANHAHEGNENNTYDTIDMMIRALLDDIKRFR